MKRRESIAHIMTSEVITLSVHDRLEDAERIFHEHKIRHIPITENHRLVGMLSLTDLLRISYVDNFDDSSVGTTVYNMFGIEQVMVKEVMSISPEDSIRDAAEILASKEFHALPVVENGQLVGIVTTTDLIKYLLEQY